MPINYGNNNVSTSGNIIAGMGDFTALQVNGTSVPTGIGTSNYATKWTDTNSLETSIIYDNGTNVGIGTSTPLSKLDVSGVITATSGNSTNWNTAYSWGDHSSFGYLTDITSQNIQDLNNVENSFNNPLLINDNILIYDSGISKFKGSTLGLGLIKQGDIPLAGYDSSYLGYYIRMNSSEFTVNEEGTNLDFRVEGDTNPNLLFVDASADRVGIGTNSPAYTLDVVGSGNFSQNLLVNGVAVSVEGHIHTPRAISASGTSGTLTPNSDTTDLYVAEGLTGAITFAVPSGTPNNGQKLLIRLKDNGTARGITWTTSSGGYRAIGVTLPTTTVMSKTTYIGCVYNSADSFWDVIAIVTQS